MFDFPVPTIDFRSVEPVLVLFITGIIALLIEVATPRKNNRAIAFVSIVGCLLAGGAAIWSLQLPTASSFGGEVVHDPFGTVLTLAVLCATLLVLLFSEDYLSEKKIAFGEFYSLAVWSASGAVMMVTSSSLLMIFIGLEVMSIALYVLAGLSRREESSEESALKYFLLGAFGGAFFLYGVAFVYGATGSIMLGDVTQTWQTGSASAQHLLAVGLGLMLVGLGFKASLVPFHQWAPDVYQGAPTNVSGFMAGIAKVAAFGALLRVLDGFVDLHQLWVPALWVVAVLSMVVGNVVALLQTDVKRVLGYSSIAHAGYLLVGLIAHSTNPGLISTFTISYYLFNYVLMTVGAFAVVSLTANKGAESTKFESLNGMAKKNPLAFAGLALFVLSLVGLPPTSGFLGKLFIVNDAIASGFSGLAIVLAICSIVSCGYYLKILIAAWRPAEGDQGQLSNAKFGLKTAVVFAMVGIICGVVFVGNLQNYIGR